MNFIGNLNATAVGSFPHADPEDTLRLIMEQTPKIPVWPQLPAFPEESMVRQYNEGMPGIYVREDKVFFDTTTADFEPALLAFYEEYLQALTEQDLPFEHRLGISPRAARALPAFLARLQTGNYQPLAIKGQITGPITLATTLTDQDKRSAYYDARLREVVVKTLAIKARWQIHQFRRFGAPVIMFIDEPCLAAYGSSAFLGISEDDVKNDLQEIIEQIHADGALAGIHCCENTDWGLLMKTGTDILSFDAYSFFDRVILYAHDLKNFIDQGNTIAWGLIPAGSPEQIEKETAGSLIEKWKGAVHTLEEQGFDMQKVISQSLITPSCGTGSLIPDFSARVMKLLREVSEGLQRAYAVG